jgi:transcriptional regulator with XRE-family HTH domain
MISLPRPHQHGDAATIATNLRRLMARHSMTFAELVAATGLDERTIRGVVRAANHPHARTLYKLAQGLGVEIDELFRPLGHFSPRQFDRATNTLVGTIVAARPELFENWTDSNFDELYSRFGAGGQLTESGVVAAAETMNAKHDLLRQIGIILESGEAELLAEFVRVIYRHVTKCNHDETE